MKKLFMGFMIASIAACTGSVNAMRREAIKVSISNHSPEMIHVYIFNSNSKCFHRHIIPPEFDNENLRIDHIHSFMGIYSKTGYYNLESLKNNKVELITPSGVTGINVGSSENNANNVLVIINPDGKVQLIDRTER